MQRKDVPCLSVDTKKKENVGLYKNNGQEYNSKGKPVEVKGHDFLDKELGKVVPYGIYDIGKNKGWVSVGTLLYKPKGFTARRINPYLTLSYQF